MFRVLLLFAAAVADRPDLSGVWQPAPGAPVPALTIEHKGDSIQILEADGTKIACGTLGKQCEFTDGGRKAHVSIWYNGPKLVLMETHGKNGETVVKKRLALSDDGSRLTLELMPISPAGKNETVVFTKKQ